MVSQTILPLCCNFHKIEKRNLNLLGFSNFVADKPEFLETVKQEWNKGGSGEDFDDSKNEKVEV